MIQFASSRSPAAGIPFHITGGTKVNAGQIKSLGPLEKCTPQSIVAVTLSHGRPACGRWPTTNQDVTDGLVLAPNPTDSTEIDRVARSDLVFVPNLTRTIARATNGQPTVEGFSCPNGVPADYGVKFACVATFTGIGNGNDQTQDNVGSGNAAGTQTIVNHGDRTIYAMQLVWASEYPYMVQDEEGNWIPGVTELGHHDKQFRFATYGMCYANVTTIMKNIEIEMEALIRDGAAADADQLEREIEKQLRLMLIRVDREKMPMYYYAFLYAAHLLMQNMVTMDVTQAAVTFIKKALDIFWEMKRRDRTKYDVALDEGLGNMEIDQTSENLLPKLTTNDLELSNKTFRQWFKEAMAAVVAGMKESQALQHDWMNARVIGLALNTAEVGKPLDVLLRAYHN